MPSTPVIEVEVRHRGLWVAKAALKVWPLLPNGIGKRVFMWAIGRVVIESRLHGRPWTELGRFDVIQDELRR